jgi:hypothetical protein
MKDYLVRQGCLPVRMQDLEREDYLRMIQDADGKPDELVDRVITNQLKTMQAFASLEQDAGRWHLA